MKIALVAMPWIVQELPCPAVGALGAYVQREMPSVEIECRFEYMNVARDLGKLYNAIGDLTPFGELLYATLLFPEKRPSLIGWAEKELESLPELRALAASGDHLFEELHAVLEGHAEELAAELAGSCDVVGFTTTYAQLFASLAVAQRLKLRAPETRIVLGGAATGTRAPLSILRTFPFVDHLVLGEGERRLVALLKGLEAGTTTFPEMQGVLSRADLDHERGGLEAPFGETASEALIADLDELPVPDYREYQPLAEEAKVLWSIPVEGSRGCWWDRTARTGDPARACRFCRLGKRTYAEKTPQRIAAEMLELSERHRSARFVFVDNVIKSKGIEPLAEALRTHGRGYQSFHWVRANLHPYRLLRLKEAGALWTQVGVEGLSSSYLKRIGKGATVIQNLQAMRTCFELELDSSSNLVIRFPGATQEEVAETAETIRRAAIAYFPLGLSTFGLYANSSVALEPERYGVTNLRNDDRFSVAIPDEVMDSLELCDLSYDEVGPRADWNEIEDLQREWGALHSNLDVGSDATYFRRPKPLYFLDGGSFLEIVDRRRGFRSITLVSPGREIYLYCTEIRSRRRIERFVDGQVSAEDLDGFLEACLSSDLMFEEDGRWLSLAVDVSPARAADRIRAAWRQDHPTDEIT